MANRAFVLMKFEIEEFQFIDKGLVFHKIMGSNRESPNIHSELFASVNF